MRRIVIALLAFQLPAVADPGPRPPAIATSGLTPGNYKASAGYTTRFDGEGRWATGGGGPSASGRYVVDGDTIMFTTSPPACENERVRYIITATETGFRLRFVDDSCKRITQLTDTLFVRL